METFLAVIFVIGMNYIFVNFRQPMAVIFYFPLPFKVSLILLEASLRSDPSDEALDIGVKAS